MLDPESFHSLTAVPDLVAQGLEPFERSPALAIVGPIPMRFLAIGLIEAFQLGVDTRVQRLLLTGQRLSTHHALLAGLGAELAAIDDHFTARQPTGITAETHEVTAQLTKRLRMLASKLGDGLKVGRQPIE